MFAKLQEQLKELEKMCRQKSSGDCMSLLDNYEKKVLFDTKALSEDLGDRISELSAIFYKHKILI